MKHFTIAFLACIFFVACKNDKNTSANYNNWEVFNGNFTANKYSSLDQIDTTNVHQLQVAWEYHTGDADTAAHSQIQCNPIVVDGVIYFTSPMLKLFAASTANNFNMGEVK